MDKLQLLMFNLIGGKLQFDESVVKRYFQVLITRYGEGSDMERQMKDFVMDPEVQKVLIGNKAHKAFQEFRYLAEMQRRHDIKKLQWCVKKQQGSPLMPGYLAAKEYLEHIPKRERMVVAEFTALSSAEYHIFEVILDSEVSLYDEESISKGMDLKTVRLVLQTMICFNESLLAKPYNYEKAEETVQVLSDLSFVCSL